MKYVAATILLWAIALAVFIRDAAHSMPVLAICMIGSVVVVRAARAAPR